MGERLANAKNLYLGAIRDGNHVDAINRYSGERYIQHSTPVRDGKVGFIEFFTNFVERNPDRHIEVIRSFEDGQYVFLHVVQTLNNGEYRYVTADIFDTDDDAKMIEHWDMIAELVDDTVSAHSQIDGPTEPSDLDATEQNKQLVGDYINDVLKNGEADKLADYISTDSYVEHNSALVEHGHDMTYEEIHLVIGCGNFVAAMSKVILADTDMAVIDLFRVADGRIVEHWDVMEAILPVDQWVNSGKF